MDDNIRKSEGGDGPARSRAIVLRCSDASWDDLLRYIRNRGDCYLVYTKTSCLKLIVSEGGF